MCLCCCYGSYTWRNNIFCLYFSTFATLRIFVFILFKELWGTHACSSETLGKLEKHMLFFPISKGRLERVKSPINLKENHILECCTCNPASLHYIFSYVCNWIATLVSCVFSLYSIVMDCYVSILRILSVFCCYGLLRNYLAYSLCILL